MNKLTTLLSLVLLCLVGTSFVQAMEKTPSKKQLDAAYNEDSDTISLEKKVEMLRVYTKSISQNFKNGIFRGMNEGINNIKVIISDIDTNYPWGNLSEKVKKDTSEAMDEADDAIGKIKEFFRG